jgi:two-component system, NarL family, nitrate/nitrite response regulator NarL
MTLRILMADDHGLFLEAVAAMVTADGSAEVVSVFDVDSALECMATQRFDLVLLDYMMPGMNGMEGLDRARSLAPQVPIAIISGITRRDLAQDVLLRGAVGFVPKTVGAKALIAAVKLMAAGETFAPMAMLDDAPQLPAPFDELTRREREVLEGICNGKSNKEIARDLDVQEVTVKLHVKTLTRKLRAKNRTHAAMLARDGGVIRRHPSSD